MAETAEGEDPGRRRRAGVSSIFRKQVCRHAVYQKVVAPKKKPWFRSSTSGANGHQTDLSQKPSQLQNIETKNRLKKTNRRFLSRKPSGSNARNSTATQDIFFSSVNSRQLRST